jgi:RNA polymerase sigma-70 factor, ECF subfamily
MDRQTDPFEVFYYKHVQWVAHRAALEVGASNAKDVTQEVFLNVFLAHARGEFDLSAPAWAWLAKATRWAARDLRRRLVREPLAAQDEVIKPMDETVRGDPDRALAVSQKWDELLELLDTLSPERRTVWVMAELDKMKLEEIAEELGFQLGTVATRLRLARADFEAALSRKRAEEKRKLGRADSLLLLPLTAEAIVRTARTLPVPELPASTSERIWRGIQDELARRGADPGGISFDYGGFGPKPSPRALGPRLKSEASHFAAIVLGTVVGLLAAMMLADTHGARHVSFEPPREQVAPTPALVVPPSVADSASAAPIGSTPSPPASSSDPEVPEQTLVEEAQKALRPPDSNPEKALRLLDLYARKYPQSRRFLDEIARLRREARSLAEKK